MNGADTSGATWYVRDGRDPSDTRWLVHGYVGPQHPDGAVVEAADAGAAVRDARPLWHADADAEGRLRLRVEPDAVPGAPATWFVALPRLQEDPPMVSLVAFAIEHLDDGAVVDQATFVGMRVRSRQQVAAIEWSPRTATIGQVFVQPDWRRRHLAMKLIYAASAYHQAHGYPGALRSDGRRTVLGDELAAGSRHPQRIAALTERAAPMDRTS